MSGNVLFDLAMSLAMMLTLSGRSSNNARSSRLWLLQAAIVLATIGVGTSSVQAQTLSITSGSNFGTFSVGDVEIQLNAIGGGGPGTYAWSIVGGALPPGVSLRSDQTSWPAYFGSNTSGALLGVATTPGTYNFVLRVTSGGQSVDQNTTVRISALAFADYWAMPKGYVGTPFSFQLTPINATGPVTFTLNGTSLPPGLTLSTTGLISGTPLAPFSQYVSLRLTDGTSTVFNSRYLTIEAVHMTTPAQMPNAIQGVAYNVPLAAVGGTAPYTFDSSNTSLPAGLVLDSSGTISGTPTAGRGSWNFWLTATDALGVSTLKGMSIDVLRAPQQAPRLQPYSNWSDDCTVGWACDRRISVFSGGTAPFTWEVTGQPPGMRVLTGMDQFWGPGDLFLAGSPALEGTFNVTVTVTDAVGVRTTNTFQMRVSPLLQRYDDFRRTDLIDGRLDVSYSKRVSLTGGTLPYTVHVVDAQFPPGLTFNESTFTLSGTPTAAGTFCPVLEYTDAVGKRLRVTDCLFIDGTNGTSNGTLDITTFYDLGTVAPGGSFTRTLTACCVPSYVWTALEPLPPGLTLSSDGVLSGTATTAGIYSFLIRVADAQFPNTNYAQQRFKLTVATPPATIPISTAFLLPYGNVGTPYSEVLAVTGVFGPLTWTLRANNYLPPGLTLDSDGTLHGTPTATGQFGFSVDVTDGAATGTRFFTIFIYAAGATAPLDLPLGINFTSAIGQFQLSLAATGGTGAYHYALEPGEPVIPGMRVQDGAPLPIGFTGTGAYLGVLTQPGAYATTIRVTDSNGAFLDRPITITVSPLQILSQNPLPRATAGAPYSFTLEPYGGAGPYAWSVTNLPPGLSINASGQILGTPTVPGTYNPQITLTDLGTPDTFRTFGYTLGVDPFAITTNGELTVGIVGIVYNQPLLAPGCTSCAWSLISGILPAGLSLTGNVISGTPTNATFGTGLIFQAAGTNGTVQKRFSLYIAFATPQPLVITTTSPLGDRTVGALTATSVFAQGGAPPYTWTLDAGALPTGITLVNSGDAAGATLTAGIAYLAGRTMQVGQYNFRLRVTDSVNATATRDLTWHVSPMNFGYFALPLTAGTLVYNAPYQQALLGVGGTGVYTWTNTVPTVPGLTLNATTGVVSGQPISTGTFSVPMQVTDGSGAYFAGTVTFSVVGPTSTTINFGLSANLGVNLSSAGSQSRDLLLSGGTPPYIVTALTPLPPGFALLSGNALLNNAATNSWFLTNTTLAPGTYTFTLQAIDSVGNVGARTFTVSIESLTQFTPSALADASVGVAYSQSIVRLGGGGGLTWSLNSNSLLPPGLNLSPGGIISGIPTQAGNYSFVLQTPSVVQPGVFLGSAFTLRVSTIAIAGPQTLPSVTTGVPYTHTLSAAGGGLLVWSATSLPAGLTMSASGTISGTTTATSGTFTVLVTVTDGVSTVQRRFTMFVTAPNPFLVSFALASTAIPDVSVGQALTFNLLPSGGVGPYTWAVAPGSALPPGLGLITGAQVPSTFAPGATTLLAGLPTTAGSYTFDLIATDSVGTQMRRTFTLLVSPISILAGTIRNATIGVAYAQQFTAVGGTSPYTFSMTPTSATQDMLPPGLTLSASGLISGTPTSTGSYAFRLQARDLLGATFTRSYTFFVTNAVGQFVNNTNIADTSVGSGRAQVLSVSGTTVGTYAWSLVPGSTLPPGMALMSGGVLGDGVTALEGRSATVGTFTYSLRATDTNNAANVVDHTFTLRVVPMQIVSPPTEFASGQLSSGEVGVPYSATIRVAGGSGPYTFSPWSLTPIPAGLTLSPSGVLSGTPTQIGFYTFSVVVADSSNTFVTGLLVLSIAPSGRTAPLLASLATGFDTASVGVPYTGAVLDRLLLGGRAPYSWSVTPGTTLPPGLALLPGSNGFSDMLAGTPTTPGTYSFSLTAADSSGQTLALPQTMSVTNLVLVPDALPNGNVGTAYGLAGLPGMPPSVSLGPSGGSPGYTIRLAPGADLPGGINLTTTGSGGTLSGTPTHPGNYLVSVIVTDSVGTTLVKNYRLTIDNAAGQAPAVSVSPHPIQIYYVQGAAIPAPTQVTIGSTHGVLPFALSINGIPGAILSATSGTTTSIVNLNPNVGALAVGTYHGFLGVVAADAANQYDLAPVTVTVATPPPCSYTVSPLVNGVPAAGGVRSFFVTTDSLCAWTATPSDLSWISIATGASGTGSGNVTYLVSPNGSSAQRNGTIAVNGQVHTVTQFGTACSFAISPVSQILPSTGGSFNVKVTASALNCAWTASSADVTPSPTSGTSGVSPTSTNPFYVNVSVAPNLGVFPRQLSATIAGQSLTVNQGGVGCSVSLSSYEAPISATGGEGSVVVTSPAGCAYDTTLGPSWISVTSGASGNGAGMLVYAVDANSTTTQRSGSLTIGGQSFKITQEGLACSVTVDTSGLGSPYGSTGGSGSIGIATNGPNCPWTASSTVPWATVTPLSGTGNGPAFVTVTSNAASATSRNGSVNISGQNVPLLQSGTICQYGLQSSLGSVPASGGNGSVGVIAPAVCAWGSTSNTSAWLTITSSGTAGTADVQFVAQPNTSTSARSGSLMVAGQTYTVNQAAAPCTYTLGFSNVTVASSVVADSFPFTASATGCAPTAVSYANWITVSTAFSATSGTVSYEVLANPFTTTRVGTIQVGDATFTIRQTGAACGYSLNSYGALFGHLGGTGNVFGSPTALGCIPDTGATQPFISLGPLAGPVTNVFTQGYSVAPFNSFTSDIRIGFVTFGGQLFAVKQSSW